MAADRAKKKKPKGQKQGTLPLTRDAQIVSEHTAMLGQFKQRRLTREDTWEKIAEYVVPIHEDIDQTEEPGEQYGLKMFDGTAPRALEIATNGTYGNLVSPGDDWFKLRAWQSELNDIAEVRAYLQDAEEQIYFALSGSNFYREIYNLMRDGLSIGTGTMLSEENVATDTIVFNTIHPAQIFIAEDQHGLVDVIYREYRSNMKHLAERVGENKLNHNQRQKLMHTPYKDVKVLHCIVTRKDFDPFKLGNLNMQVASYLIDLDENLLMEESGYNEFPGTTWRYQKNTGEFYGRSPGEMILPTIMGLNQMSEDMLYVSEMGAMPPVWAEEDLRGKVNMTPRGITFGSKDSMGVLNTGNNYSIGTDREERLQQAIRDAYNVDFFTALAQSERQRTAFEVAELKGEQALILAPAIGRMTGEVLSPSLERVFSIEERAGRMPDIPPILEDMGENGKIDIRYLGPLAQIQTRSFQSKGIPQGMELLVPLMQVAPEIKHDFDFSVIARNLARSFNFPETSIRSKEDARKSKEAEAAAIAQAQAGEQASQGAGTIKDLASANKELGGGMEGTIEEALTGGV
jgi:hypothetical protein